MIQIIKKGFLTLAIFDSCELVINFVFFYILSFTLITCVGNYWPNKMIRGRV